MDKETKEKVEKFGLLMRKIQDEIACNLPEEASTEATAELLFRASQRLYLSKHSPEETILFIDTKKYDFLQNYELFHGIEKSDNFFDNKKLKDSIKDNTFPIENCPAVTNGDFLGTWRAISDSFDHQDKLLISLIRCTPASRKDSNSSVRMEEFCRFERNGKEMTRRYIRYKFDNSFVGRNDVINKSRVIDIESITYRDEGILRINGKKIYEDKHSQLQVGDFHMERYNGNISTLIKELGFIAKPKESRN